MAVDAAIWEALPAEERASISRAIIDVVRDRLSVNPSHGREVPSVHVLGAKRGPTRLWLQIVIDHYIYCYAQSGSDWAEHQIFVGDVVLEGTKVVMHQLETAMDLTLRESDTEDYVPSEPRDKIIASTLAKLRAPRTVRITRCPVCGSTDAGENGGVADLAWMHCRSCGLRRMQDNYEIYDDWEVPYELADVFDEPPPFLPPLPT